VSGAGSDPAGSGLVGYKARRHTDVIDVDRIDYYDPREFWEPV
jgi:dCTP deaminase